jgi:hypothetical protein
MQTHSDVNSALRASRRGHNRWRISRAAAVLFAILALLACWALTAQGRAVAATNDRGRGVLPPSATPKGYSLNDMSRLTALFTTSGNDVKYLPKTPFQILYVAPGNSFTVKAGTMFYVPLWNADDSPPVAGVFPTTPSEARHYWFDADQLGAKGFLIQIDSTTTHLGERYVAGPVTTPPLLDGGGTHYTTIGAFLNPLTPGVHTVRIEGGLFGPLIEATYGVPSLTEDISYSVRVQR